MVQDRTTNALSTRAIGGLIGLALATLLGLPAADAEGLTNLPHAKQVFPPRSSQSATPSNPAPPAAAAAPGSLVRTIPFGTLLGGDFTKSFIQLANLRSPADSNFVMGRGLTGRVMLERHIFEAGNGNKVYFHVNGLSNPPTISSEGNELHLRYLFPAIQFKGYYKDYSNEGDQAMPDVVLEKAVADVYFTPVTDQRGLPTFQSARVIFTGALTPPEKCRVWFDVIFPVNFCDIVTDYLKQMKPTIEHGVREALQHPQTRVQFDQAVWQFLRGDLLTQAGINPASPAQIQIVQASFRGTDYVVSFVPRP